MTHELKILPKWFEDVKFGLKNFEIRKNDRDYKVGDIFINPWVSKYFNGKLNPLYATIYLGDGASVTYKGKVVRFLFNTKVNRNDLDEKEREWKVIGHVDIKEIILKALADKGEVIQLYIEHPFK